MFIHEAEFVTCDHARARVTTIMVLFVKHFLWLRGETNSGVVDGCCMWLLMVCWFRVVMYVVAQMFPLPFLFACCTLVWFAFLPHICFVCLLNGCTSVRIWVGCEIV